MRGVALGILAGVAAASAVQAADFAAPPRKPGLWKMTMAGSHGGKANPPTTMSMCLDASVDKAMNVMGTSMGKQSCSSQNFSKTLTGYKFNSVCTIAGAGTVKSDGTITGDLQKAYKMDVNGSVSGASMAAMNGPSHTTIDAAWSGPCPATMKPGDMLLPGGMKVNMMAATSAAASMAARRH